MRNVSYKYNTLGQLLEKTTPDQGLEKYRYDVEGNLIFSQNKSEALEGKLSFITYDFANRPLLQGKTSGSIETIANSFLPPANDVQIKYHYDAAVSASVFSDKPAVKILMQGFVFGNPKGRLTMSEYKSGGKWQYELYSFDNIGNVDQKKIITEVPGGVKGTASATLLKYYYNLQNMITRRQVIAGGKQFFHWFDYDEFGQLDRVYSSTSGTKPSSPVMTYEYDQNNQNTRRTYALPGTDLVINNQFNLRQWVKRIDVTSNSKKFWSDYNYLDNGNIYAIQYYNQPVSGAEKNGKYSYTYDGLNQLKTAVFSSLNGSSWSNDNRYRVDNLNYDANGNILSLNRYDNNKQLIDRLTYNYSHNNRLQKVNDNSNKFNGWDAQTGEYHYDHRGNLTNSSNASAHNVTFFKQNDLNLIETVETGSNSVAVQLNTKGYSKSGTGMFQYKLANGSYRSLSGRGLWVIQLSANGISVIASRHFDMYSDGLSSKQGTALASYLNSIPRDGRIVLVGAYYSATNYYGSEWTESAYQAMEKLGATEIRKVKIFDNYAFAVAAGKPYTAMEQHIKFYYYDSAPFKCDLKFPVNRSVEVQYRYNLHGQRFYKKFANGNVEHYIMDGDLCLGISDKGGKVQYWNLLGNGIEGRYEAGSGKYYYYIKDHLGSTRLVLRNDNVVIEANDYYPFGLKMPGRSYLNSAQPTKEGFTGKELDKETNLTYFGARYYNPAIGRWYSTDFNNYPGWSPFNYTFNNPIVIFDPDGNGGKDVTEVGLKYIGVGYVYGNKAGDPKYLKSVRNTVGRKGIDEISSRNHALIAMGKNPIMGCGLDCSGFASIVNNMNPDRSHDWNGMRAIGILNFASKHSDDYSIINDPGKLQEGDFLINKKTSHIAIVIKDPETGKLTVIEAKQTGTDIDKSKKRYKYMRKNIGKGKDYVGIHDKGNDKKENSPFSSSIVGYESASNIHFYYKEKEEQ